jgi:hypothetical protein
MERSFFRRQCRALDRADERRGAARLLHVHHVDGTSFHRGGGRWRSLLRLGLDGLWNWFHCRRDADAGDPAWPAGAPRLRTRALVLYGRQHLLRDGARHGRGHPRPGNSRLCRRSAGGRRNLDDSYPVPGPASLPRHRARVERVGADIHGRSFRRRNPRAVRIVAERLRVRFAFRRHRGNPCRSRVAVATGRTGSRRADLFGGAGASDGSDRRRRPGPVRGERARQHSRGDRRHRHSRRLPRGCRSARPARRAADPARRGIHPGQSGRRKLDVDDVARAGRRRTTPPRSSPATSPRCPAWHGR